MRLHSLVAAAALLSASLAAHADTIIQNFAVPFSYPNAGYSTYNGTFPATPFNVALGTLNSVSLFANGSITIAGSDFNAGTNTFFYGQTGDLGFTANPYFSHDGTFNVSYGSTSTDPFILQSVEIPSGTDINFEGQFISSANVTGTITYDYTPVATTPEPSSLALLGTGLLGAVGVIRKRYA